jgi:hypothetical protein
MKILINFLNQNSKDKIISPFVNYKDCTATDDNLIIPGILKVDYSSTGIKCYCYSLYIAEIIISSVCTVSVSEDSNNGNVVFPNNLDSIMLECNIFSFNKILELAVNGTTNYINTEKEQIKANMSLSQWLSADINVNNGKALIKLQCNNYNVSVSDKSAKVFCDRIKEHPLIFADNLKKYFDFGSEIKIEPKIEYVYFYKMLKSDTGYKKYSNFINDNKDLNFKYNAGKEYTCNLSDTGKIEFKLVDIGDKYPKRIIFQTGEYDDLSILNKLKKYFNINNISIIAKVSNLKLSLDSLLNKLNFYKDEDFFVFANVKDNLKATYNIYNNIMNIRQDIKIDEIDTIDNEKNKVEELIEEFVSYNE